MKMNNAKKQITTFVILFTTFSIIVYTLFLTGFIKHGFNLWIMWCPGVAAIITRLIHQRNLRNFGWGWGKTRYQAASYFLPLLLALIVYGIVWLTGLGEISVENFTNSIAKFFGLTEPLSLLPSFLILASIIIFLSGIAAFGEEIGWRGLLVPELAKLTSYTRVSLISGAVWAVWHIPGILFVGYTSGITAWFTIPCFAVMVISASFVFTWLRLKSGSVWTAVILHTTHNLFIQGFFDVLTVDTGNTKYITTEFGIGLAIAYAVAAFICWKKRNELA
ncbi:MAG: hypothetical protein A2V66_16390 [Ignavibacteria bacterium RBG_13_36_8]|nr:MAG: hypothetical protein A2V66_16390 [Ignavibacteria bacterium RBG_13_36_8]